MVLGLDDSVCGGAFAWDVTIALLSVLKSSLSVDELWVLGLYCCCCVAL